MRLTWMIAVMWLVAGCGGPSSDVPADAPLAADAGVHVETLPPVRLREGLRGLTRRGGLEVVEARDGSALVLISGAPRGAYSVPGPAALVALDSRGEPLSELPTLPPEFVALRARTFAGGWLVWSGAGSAWARVSPRGELTVLADAPRRCGLEAWPTGEGITVLSAPEGCGSPGTLELQELGADGRWSSPRVLEFGWGPSGVHAALGSTRLVIALFQVGGSRALYEVDSLTGELLRDLPLGGVMSVSSARIAADGSAQFLAWRTPTEPVLLSLEADGVVTHPVDLPCSLNTLGTFWWQTNLLLGGTHVRCRDREERGDWQARLDDEGRVSEAELLAWPTRWDRSDASNTLFDRSWPSGLSVSTPRLDEGEVQQELLVIPASGGEHTVPIAPNGPHQYSTGETLTRAPWGAVVRLGSRLVLLRSDASVAAEVDASPVFTPTDDGVVAFLEAPPRTDPAVPARYSLVAYGLDGSVSWRREEAAAIASASALTWTGDRLVTVQGGVVQIRDASGTILSEGQPGMQAVAADDGRVLLSPYPPENWRVLDRDGTVLIANGYLSDTSPGAVDRSCGASCWTGPTCGREVHFVDGRLEVVERDCPAGYQALFAPSATAAGERALVRVDSPVVSPPNCREVTGVTWFSRSGLPLVESPVVPFDFCSFGNPMLVRPDGELWVLRSPPFAVRSYEDGFLQLTRVRLVHEH